MKEKMALFDEYIEDLKHGRQDKRKNEKIRNGFYDLLREQHVDKETRWRNIKEQISGDPRYKAANNQSREDLFYDFMRSIKKTKDEEMREREEASLKAREAEVRREKRPEMARKNRERQHLRKEELSTQFILLLNETIRDDNLKWKEVRKGLQKDIRWGDLDDLDEDRLEDLYDDHVTTIRRKRRDAFHRLIDEAPVIELDTTWEDARPHICTEDRFEKFGVDESQREEEFVRYQKIRKEKALADFKELLTETKFITHKSWDLINDEENEVHMKEIIQALENDKRYLQLSCFSEDRGKIMTEYTRELKVSLSDFRCMISFFILI
eukprot:m.72752 g.72752  ORF g.72752 m.72752 type:complete len:324 (+) comp12356_c0_seq1:1233-2204(+)